MKKEKLPRWKFKLARKAKDPLKAISYQLSANSGFTLIELLIVVSILGVLITLGYQSFNLAQIKARDGQRKSDLKQIQQALELYKQDQLPAWAYPPTSAWGVFQTTLQNGGYMKTTPADPLPTSWSWPQYSYTRNATDNLRFTLIACLENTKDSNKDTVNNAYCTSGWS